MMGAGWQQTDFREPADIVGSIVRQVLERGLMRRLLLNINIPFMPRANLGGVRITRLGTRVYEDTLVRKVDPRGRDYFWIGGEDPVWRPDEGILLSGIDETFSLTSLPIEIPLADVYYNVEFPES